MHSNRDRFINIKIIEIKRQYFPILFDQLIATLEKTYIEYFKDLIDSENKIIIRSQGDRPEFIEEILAY